MWGLLTVFILLALILYVMFFWVPGEETRTACTTLAAAKNGVTGAAAATGASLTAERCWYGITFHGYQDEYLFETPRTAQDALKNAREFFVGRNAKILVEDSHHLRLSKGRSKTQAYLTGLDTWFPHELDISLQMRPESTRVVLRYYVPGFHIRVPPNQLRREVLGLQAMMQISRAEPTAALNGGPAVVSGNSRATEGRPLVS